MDILDIRAKIDKLDEQIITLLNERYKFVLKLIEEKNLKEMALEDPRREQEIYERINKFKDPSFPEGCYKAIYNKIFELSKKLQIR